MAEHDLTDKEILNRIEIADTWLKKFRDSDNMVSNWYLDANTQTVSTQDDWSLQDDFFDPEADIPQEVPIGQPNYLAINNETRIAAIAMGMPALHVRANESPERGGIPKAGEIVAKAWEQSWQNGNWKREAQASLQKLGICGLGMAWYRWDSVYGPCFEHVPSVRLLLDPHATNLYRLEYGGVKVRMSLRRALRLYDPDGKKEFFKIDTVDLSAREGDDTKHLDTSVVTISIYFDREREAVAYRDKIVYRDVNRYKRIPLLPIEGFIDPRGRLLPLGDNIFASGLSQQVVDLAAIASSTAKHGGPITFGDTNFFDRKTQDALSEGNQQSVIFTINPINPTTPPLYRIPGEQLSPAWPEARREAQQALDGIMGVTPAARGEQIQNVTATQSVMVEQRAGARPMQAKADVETWLTRWAEAYVWMMREFGGPTLEEPGTQETREIWEAMKATYEVRVVEGSTSFRNPASDQQAAMQLYTTFSQSYELWVALATQGLSDVVPNMKEIADNVHRTFSIQNIDKMWQPAPQPQEKEEPPEAMLKALAALYKESPPDVRRQIEENFGLTPSELGEIQEQSGKPLLEMAHEEGMQLSEQQHDLRMKGLEIAGAEQQQAHDERMSKTQAIVQGRKNSDRQKRK